MKLVKLECPNCKAPLEIDQDRLFVFCQYCGTKILLDDEEQRININANIDQQYVMLMKQKWPLKTIYAIELTINGNC